MATNHQIDKALALLMLRQREEEFHYHPYDLELRQYDLIKQGDLASLEEGRRFYEGSNIGTLSDDPVLNYKYHFVSTITLTCRFCIEGGMTTETAYALSDIYIRQADRCTTVQELFDLHDAMYRDYTVRMQAIIRSRTYPRPVHRAVDFIDQHLQTPFTLRDLADYAGVTPTYLSALFKKETGNTISGYVRDKRIHAAGMLLQYTDFTCLVIAEYFCFSSECHFSKVFKKCTGMAPGEFRKKNYRNHWE